MMEKENKNANRDRLNAGVNYQEASHNEGQQNNTVPATGQPSPHNTSSSVKEMQNDAPEQTEGREKDK